LFENCTCYLKNFCHFFLHTNTHTHTHTHNARAHNKRVISTTRKF